MISLDHLAFVDIETSGVSLTQDRITEIAVVAIDGTEVKEWATLVNPGRQISERSRLFNGVGTDAASDTPRFKDIAADLAAQLKGRLFIAHNARFDFSFLRSEFERVGISFQAQLLCSVALSRKLYPMYRKHDLDTLMQRYGLQADVRHRALPDARLLWQFWQVLQTAHTREHLISVSAALLAEPVLPAHLDTSLIDKLPDAPGVYVLRGDDGTVLHAGKAHNLRLHVLNYFRTDRISRKALDVSHRVGNITWQVTRGPIGTTLKLSALSSTLLPARRHRNTKAVYSWRLIPYTYPCVELMPLPENQRGEECYGLYESELKARNALLRLATGNNLCHALLGISESTATPCTGCAVNDRTNCGFKTARLRQFTKLVVALAPLRIAQWPYDGPIGIRERSDLHILDDWRYLGTAQNEHEIYPILETRREVFDESTFAFLAKTLSRVPRRRIVRLKADMEMHN
jgi:DNA polymerase-3 subunit epsilon